jgi:hypothetical protein
MVLAPRVTRTDKQLAEHSVLTLDRSRFVHRSTALRDLLVLRNEVGSGPNVENERAAAWVAIGHLCKALREAPVSDELDAHWQNAIEQTKAWQTALA